MPKLTKQFVDRVSLPQQDKTYWDDEIKGFGLRVQGNTKAWVLVYRNRFGNKKRLTLGRSDKLCPQDARNAAKSKLATIFRDNEDPASEKSKYKKSLTVAELCDFYLEEGVSNKKPSTIANDKSRIERHVKPLIGNLSLLELRSHHLEKMVIDIKRGKTAFYEKGKKPRASINVTGGNSIAKRTLEMLSGILSFAKRRGLITENPAIGVEKPKTNKREVFLTLDDCKTLGEALRTAEKLKFPINAINAIKLLVLTGCRKDEILSLRWEYVDFENQCFRFPDTKTGQQNRAFGIGALNLLKSMTPFTSTGFVFPSTVAETHLTGLLKIFKKIISLRPLVDEQADELLLDMEQPPYISKPICLHSLRHSFASIAANMNYNELTIAGLLGHKLGGVTNRYSHNVDSTLISAANNVSQKIANALDNITPETAKIISITRGA